MIRERDVIHFSLDDYWRSDPHSRLWLTRQFWRNNNRVFWINTFGMRIPKITKRGFLKKVLGKAKSYLRLLRQVDVRFWVYTPIALPVLGSPLLRRLQDFSLLLQIRLLMHLFRVRKPVLFVGSPMFATVIPRIQRDTTIYYCSDDYASYREITHKDRVAQLHDMTIRLADWTFCASRNIFQSISAKTTKVSYLPHGVDFDLFNGVLTENTLTPDDLRNIPRPIVGYFGSLTDSNDIELIEYLARARPTYSIVLIGEPTVDYRSLAKIENVHLLGRKAHDKIPLYGKHFDVCFMAWRETEWIRNSSPLKTLEYLALGKPVVSSSIDEIRRSFSRVVNVAEGRSDFLRKIDESLTHDTPEKRKARIAFARNQTWEARFEVMSEVIEARQRPQSTEPAGASF